MFRGGWFCKRCPTSIFIPKKYSRMFSKLKKVIYGEQISRMCTSQNNEILTAWKKWCLYQITQPLPLKSQILHPVSLFPELPNLTTDGIAYCCVACPYKNPPFNSFFSQSFQSFGLDMFPKQTTLKCPIEIALHCNPSVEPATGAVAKTAEATPSVMYLSFRQTWDQIRGVEYDCARRKTWATHSREC